MCIYISHEMTTMQKSQENPSAFRSEFWGICCESGKKYSQVVTKKFHLSMAALDPTVSGTSPCVSLMVERGGCQYLLCNLKPDTVLQVSLNLFFDIGEKVTFFLKGNRGTVHLSGYHIFQDGDESLTNDFSKSPSGSPRKVLKGTILDSDLDLDDETDSDDGDYDEDDEDDDDSDIDVEEGDTKPKKNATVAKVVSPGQKTNSPGATPTKKLQTPQAANKKDATPKANIKVANLKAIMNDSKTLNKLVSKRTLEEEGSDDDFSEEDSEDSSDEEEAQPKQKPKDFQSNKRLKTNSSTPLPAKKVGNRNTPKVSAAEVIDLEDDAPKNAINSFTKGDPNSSIGRTPMPKKSVSSIFQSSLNDTPGNKKNLKNKLSFKDAGSDEDSDEMEVSVADKTQSPSQQMNTSAQSAESKKKRKKKKKKVAAAAANDSQVLESTPAKLNESVSAPKSAKKLPCGIECEDLKVGYGLEAKKGKIVYVYYTGKLENNKVFDSRQPGSKPFSFKLGTGQVIKGWDLGLEGMKVGGKRKLKIPPHMAYKNQRMGDIPPSSTLNFVVELKAVA